MGQGAERICESLQAIMQQRPRRSDPHRPLQPDLDSLQSASLYLSEVIFSPVTVRDGNARPDFVVLGLYRLDHGSFELGAAWKKTSKAGKPYLSVKLDSPAFAEPISRDGGTPPATVHTTPVPAHSMHLTVCRRSSPPS